ncbi:MAG: site-2 protease family protein [Thermoplasmata archaeon]
MISDLYILLLALILWGLLIIGLGPIIKKSKHFSLYGPAIMVKAVRNRGLLDKFSRIIPKDFTSKLFVVATYSFLIFGMAFLLYEAYLSLQIKVSSAPNAASFLILPGINPFIPVFYGTFALVFSVVIHEIMHGVIARKHNISVKSVGGLFFVIPIGAFVEPDPDQMAAADPVVRRRIFAAGPATNIILSIIFFILLVAVLMPSAQPIHQGLYVTQNLPSSSVASAGIGDGSELISFANYSGQNFSNLEYNSAISPGTMESAVFFHNGLTTNIKMPAGIYIVSLVPGFPGEKAGLRTGQIFYSIDGTIIYNMNNLTQKLDSIPPGKTIPVEMINWNQNNGSESIQVYEITTVSTYSYYEQVSPLANNPAYRNESFIGFSPAYIGIVGMPISTLKTLIFGSSALSFTRDGVLETLALPFLGLSPVPSSVMSLFTVGNPLIFWFTVNLFFWLFWMNFLLGLTNALPIFVFDGGQFFRDTLLIASRRPRFKYFASQKNINKTMMAVGLLVIFLIIWQIVVPEII